MKKPLNLTLLHRRLSMFLWLSAFGFGMVLTGCVLQQRPEPSVVGETVEPPPPAQPPCPDFSDRELEKQALELLDRGESKLARTLLECALELNSNASNARNLIEQLDADPVEYLGRRNYPYMVQSSDTLSRIAQERLGSSLKFVSLARYNGIAVPANLVAGQTIRIPGEDPGEVIPPPATAAPPPSSKSSANQYQDQALANEEDGNFEVALELIMQARNDDASLENIEEDYSRIKDLLIAQLEEKAYNLELSGSPEEAVETWRQVLQIDPGNIQAQLSIKRLTKNGPGS